MPDLGLLLDHAGTCPGGAFALVMIGFSQTAGDARAFAAKHRYQVDIDQESVAQAAANIGAGLLTGMPVSTSLSASSLNDRSGARTGLASLTSGVTVVLALLFLAPFFSALPKPVLAALIIEAVVMGMMDVAEMRRMRRVSRVDFWVAAGRAPRHPRLRHPRRGGHRDRAVAASGSSTSPRTRRCRRWAGSRGRRSSATSREHPEDETFPGIVVLRMDGGIFFATADALEDRVRTAMLAPDVDGVVLHFAGVNFVDSQGAATVSEIVRIAEESGVDLRLAAVRPAYAGCSSGTARWTGSGPTGSTATSTGP